MSELKLLTVTGYKGGIAKSTTAIHLATFFSQHGKTVLADGDPNRTCISWSQRGIDKGMPLPFTVVSEKQAPKFMRNAEFLIIDTAARPNSTDLEELANGCDLLILPTVPDVLGLEPMLETAKDLPESSLYRVLISVVPSYPSRAGEVLKTQLNSAGIPLFNTMIRRSSKVPDAALQGVSVKALTKSRYAQAVWNEYVKVGEEIMEIIK